MDLGVIYRKTAAGEDALRERSRLRRSRLRAVLILVDGQTRAQELCQKLGAGFRPKATLSQLERLGFIEPSTVQPLGDPPPPTLAARGTPESLDPHAQTVAPALGLDAPAAACPQTEPEALDKSETGQALAPAPLAAVEIDADLHEAVLDPPQVREADPGESQAIAEPELEPEPSEPADSAESAEPANLPQPVAQAPEQVVQERPADIEAAETQSTQPLESAASAPQPLSAQIETITVAEVEPVFAEASPAPGAHTKDREAELDDGDDWPDSLIPSEPAPAPRAARARGKPLPERWAHLRTALGAAFEQRPRLPSWRLRLSRRAGIAFLLLVLLLGGALAATLIPFQRYRSNFEQSASAAIGLPVTVGSIGLSMSPGPSIALHDVALGAPPVIRVPVVRVLPNAGTLFGDQRLGVSLRAEGGEINGAAFAALCSGAARAPQEPGDIVIERIEFAALAARIGGANLSGLGGEVRLNEPQRPITLRSADDMLRAVLRSGERGCPIEIEAHGLKLPWGPGLSVPLLEARGTLAASGLDLTKIEARLQDGTVRGKGSLAWGERVRLALQLELNHLELARFLPAMGIDLLAQGRMGGTLQVAADAADPGQLAQAVSGRGALTVSRGAVQRFDLVDALRLGGVAAVRGGTTRFEQLDLSLQFQPGAASLRDIRLDGGALSASGSIRVTGGNQLVGGLAAQMHGPGATRRVALEVGGTLAAPRLTPNGG
jgi:hypothetical protein